MSLVNDMLKDLDRRKRLASGAVPSIFLSDQDFDISGVKNWKVMALILAGILLGAASGYFFFQDSSPAVIEQDFNLDSQLMGVAGNSNANQELGSTGSPAQEESSQSNSLDSSVSIFADSNTAAGFVLRVVSINNFSFEVVSRDDYGVEILLPGLRNISHNDVNIVGLRVNSSDAGIRISVARKDAFDFLVYEESSVGNAIGKSLIIEGLARQKSQLESINALTTIDQSIESNISTNTAPNFLETLEESVEIERAPVKTARLLSLEERDINNSKNAASLIQRGQIIDAYAQLLRFIEDNAEAHHSRETLATLLFAQQEYQQAEVIVDQGLLFAPNYSAYKKIKARLLILDRDPGAAANYLSDNPPALATDPEYFELLASAYQQNMQHANAIETYQNLIRHDSQQARWWVGMGVSLEAGGEVDDAISSYQTALQNSELDSALRQYSQNRMRFLRN